jgi:general stress protein 26
MGEVMFPAMSDDIRNEIFNHFDEFQRVYFATAEGILPRVRPVTMVYLDNQFWVFTNSKKEILKEVEAIPNFEFLLTFNKGEHLGHIRVSGLVNITEDVQKTEQIVGELKKFNPDWTGPGDPNYILFELDVVEIEYMKPGEFPAHKYKMK